MMQGPAGGGGFERRSMGEGQPSISDEEDPGQDGPRPGQPGAEGGPQEIESVDSGNRNVETKLDMAAGTSNTNQETGGAGPSSARAEAPGPVAVRIADADAGRVNDSLGAERPGSGEEGDLRRSRDDPSSRGTAEEAGTTTAAAATDKNIWPAVVGAGRTSAPDKSKDTHFIDIPHRDVGKMEELDGYKGFSIARTASNFSVESGSGDQCRICQQHTDEPLMDLGCHCRGELAKAHRSCVDHWFGNKGTNKCEVCQHIATNVPVPSSQPTPHFWVWRVGGGPFNGAAPRRIGGVGSLRINPLPMRPVLLMTLRRHPTIMLLWLLLFAFMAYLFVDVTDSASIGYAAMPIGFLFGVLVVLGLGTAARLVLECWHERAIRRNIQRMEDEPNFEDFPGEQGNGNTQMEIPEAQPFSNGPHQGGIVHGTAGASQVAPTG